MSSRRIYGSPSRARARGLSQAEAIEELGFFEEAMIAGNDGAPDPNDNDALLDPPAPVFPFYDPDVEEESDATQGAVVAAPAIHVDTDVEMEDTATVSTTHAQRDRVALNSRNNEHRQRIKRVARDALSGHSAAADLIARMVTTLPAGSQADEWGQTNIFFRNGDQVHHAQLKTPHKFAGTTTKFVFDEDRFTKLFSPPTTFQRRAVFRRGGLGIRLGMWVAVDLNDGTKYYEGDFKEGVVKFLPPEIPSTEAIDDEAATDDRVAGASGHREEETKSPDHSFPQDDRDVEAGGGAAASPNQRDKKRSRVTSSPLRGWMLGQEKDSANEDSDDDDFQMEQQQDERSVTVSSAALGSSVQGQQQDSASKEDDDDFQMEQQQDERSVTVSSAALGSSVQGQQQDSASKEDDDDFQMEQQQDERSVTVSSAALGSSVQGQQQDSASKEDDDDFQMEQQQDERSVTVSSAALGSSVQGQQQDSASKEDDEESVTSGPRKFTTLTIASARDDELLAAIKDRIYSDPSGNLAGDLTDLVTNHRDPQFPFDTETSSDTDAADNDTGDPDREPSYSSHSNVINTKDGADRPTQSEIERATSDIFEEYRKVEALIESVEQIEDDTEREAEKERTKSDEHGLGKYRPYYRALHARDMCEILTSFHWEMQDRSRGTAVTAVTTFALRLGHCPNCDGSFADGTHKASSSLGAQSDLQNGVMARHVAIGDTNLRRQCPGTGARGYCPKCSLLEMTEWVLGYSDVLPWTPFCVVLQANGGEQCNRVVRKLFQRLELEYDWEVAAFCESIHPRYICNP